MSDQIELAAAVMVRDYFILAFIVSLGALQIVTSISGIRGLWVFPRGDITRVLGIVLIAIGLGYYIFSPLWLEGPWSAGSVIDGTSEGRVWGTATLDEISGARNLNDIHGGMAGTAYAGYFILSAVLATVFAAVVGAVNVRLMASVPFWLRHFSREHCHSRVGGNPEGRMGKRNDTSKPPLIPPFASQKWEGSNVRPVDSRLRENDDALRNGHLDGLDALKASDAFSTLSASIGNLRRTGVEDARQSWIEAPRWSIPSLIGRKWRN